MMWRQHGIISVSLCVFKLRSGSVSAWHTISHDQCQSNWLPRATWLARSSTRSIGTRCWGPDDVDGIFCRKVEAGEEEGREREIFLFWGRIQFIRRYAFLHKHIYILLTYGALLRNCWWFWSVQFFAVLLYFRYLFSWPITLEITPQ